MLRRRSIGVFRYKDDLLGERIIAAIIEAIRLARDEGDFPADAPLEAGLTEPKGEPPSDFATNYALVNSKRLGRNPRELAQSLASRLSKSPLFSKVDVAGPGFLNLSVRPEVLAAYVGEILTGGTDYAKRRKDNPRRLNVEFVSVNPNGPITVGSGRGAAFGDCLCRVLRASGDLVDAEYYINDALNSQQMKVFAESVRHYLAEGEGHDSLFPEGGYKGEYVKDVATELAAEGFKFDQPLELLQKKSEALMIERQRGDLATFGVTFDRWFSEQTLHEGGEVMAAIGELEKNGSADRVPYYTETAREGKESRLQKVDQDPGPLWLRSTKFGDEKDRVLVRSDGRPAYIAGDLAYLWDKLGRRRYDKAILIVGPDHHGYIGRMMAVCQALGFSQERFEILIFQIVRFVKDGQPAPMRKRDGNIYELRDLVLELGKSAAATSNLEEQTRIGRDVARFFYLMRSHETHMDFDIDLATKQSDENPVFYVQYAHARICSVIAKAREAGIAADEWRPSYAALLGDPREASLIKKLLELSVEIARCAEDYEVHRLTTYAIELSRTYHHFYDACRVIQPDQPDLTQARLCLCQAAKIGLQATLQLLGVSAPERMDRAPSVAG